MTSISDRCKTALDDPDERLALPWGVGTNEWGDDYPTETNWRNGKPQEMEEYRNKQVHLIALAPEAADEVVRLTDALEDLAERFGVQIMRANDLNNEEMFYMSRVAQAMIWNILNPNGDPDDVDHP